eukprot:6375871-Amphidinium_carterae.1
MNAVSVMPSALAKATKRVAYAHGLSIQECERRRLRWVHLRNPKHVGEGVWQGGLPSRFFAYSDTTSSTVARQRATLGLGLLHMDGIASIERDSLFTVLKIQTK